MNVFTLDSNGGGGGERMNLDELYEKKREQDMKQAEMYSRVLNRVHVKIKTIARRTTKETYCWFQVPEMILGVSRYNQSECIAFLISKLNQSQFQVKYYHPNYIFITWNHWVPSYVRTELKNRAGIEINEYGEVLPPKPKEDELEEIQELPPSSSSSSSSKRTYKPIEPYKPFF
jgi:hypothetical protein